MIVFGLGYVAGVATVVILMLFAAKGFSLRG
jgi:hypothetical protein